MRGSVSVPGDRGQSEVLGYVLSLALVSVLIGGTVVSGQTLLEGQDKIRKGGAMEEQGQRLARTMMTVDRLVRQSDSDGEIAQSLDLPTKIRNDRYRLTIINASRTSTTAACSRPCLVLQTESINRTIHFKTEYPVESKTVIGGPLRIVRPDNGSMIRIETNG